MAANPIWIAAYGNAPPAAIGATPVWIASPAVVGATESQVVAYGGSVAGATAVWIAAYENAPPVAVGAAPIWISGVGAGAGGAAPVTSVWSAADATANAMTLSNGGLTVTPSGVAAWQSIRGSTSQTSGKLYVEMLGAGSFSSPNDLIGFASASFNPANYLGATTYSASIGPGGSGGYGQVSSGFTMNFQTGILHPAANDVFGLAIDFAAGKIWFARNNVWDTGSNPATGTAPTISFTPATVGALFPAHSFNGPGNGVWTLQPTAASQKYAPPSGFQAWDGGPVTPPAAAVWDAATVSAVTLSGSNLVATSTGTTSTNQGAHVAFASGQTTGKYYFEITLTTFTGGAGVAVGIGTTAAVYSTISTAATHGAMCYMVGHNGLGTIFTDIGGNSGLSIGARTTGNVIGIAVDFGSGKMWFRLAPSGLWDGSGSHDPTNPAAGGIALPTGGAIVPFVTFGSGLSGAAGVAGNVFTANFGGSAFIGAVPSGYTVGWPA